MTSGEVRSILAKGYDTRKIDEVIPWLEAANSKIVPHDIDILSLECPRAFKSHMPHHLMPCGLPSNTPCKYIYVTQNLKDAAVCYFCHYFTLKRAENFDWDIFIIGLSLVNYDYFEHVLTWWKHKNDENVLFIRRYAEISDPASSKLLLS